MGHLTARDPPTGAETTADESFRVLKTGRWCWWLGRSGCSCLGRRRTGQSPKRTDSTAAPNLYFEEIEWKSLINSFIPSSLFQSQLEQGPNSLVSVLSSKACATLQKI